MTGIKTSNLQRCVDMLKNGFALFFFFTPKNIRKNVVDSLFTIISQNRSFVG